MNESQLQARIRSVIPASKGCFKRLCSRNRTSLALLGVHAVLRGIGIILFHHWLRHDTPLHSLAQDHTTILVKTLERVWHVAIASYIATFAGLYILLLYINRRCTNHEQFNKMAFSLLQVSLLAMLFVDFSSASGVQVATGGVTSGFRVVGFVLMTMSMLSIASDTVASAFAGLHVLMFVYLYKSRFPEGNNDDFVIALSSYFAVWVFLGFVRRLFRVDRILDASLEDGGADSVQEAEAA